MNKFKYGFRQTELMKRAWNGGGMDIATISEQANKSTSLGYTALMFACHRGHEEVARTLVEHGADVNAKTNETPIANPLSLATAKGHRSIMRMLKKAGAKGVFISEELWEHLRGSTVGKVIRERLPVLENINLPLNGNNVPAIAIAASWGKIPIIKALMKEGADVNAKSILGHTPLSLAIKYHKPKTAEFLIHAGADVNAIYRESIRRESPLSHAVDLGYFSLIDLLLEKGADVGFQTDDTFSTILRVAKVRSKDKDTTYARKYKKIVKALEGKGASTSLESRDRFGQTPFMQVILAWIHYSKDGYDNGARDARAQAEGFIDRGSNINASDNKGRTAMDIAKQEGCSEVVEFLKEKGAAE